MKKTLFYLALLLTTSLYATTNNTNERILIVTKSLIRKEGIQQKIPTYLLTLICYFIVGKQTPKPSIHIHCNKSKKKLFPYNPKHLTDKIEYIDYPITLSTENSQNNIIITPFNTRTETNLSTDPITPLETQESLNSQQLDKIDHITSFAQINRLPDITFIKYMDINSRSSSLTNKKTPTTKQSIKNNKPPRENKTMTSLEILNLIQHEQPWHHLSSPERNSNSYALIKNPTTPQPLILSQTSSIDSLSDEENITSQTTPTEPTNLEQPIDTNNSLDILSTHQQPTVHIPRFDTNLNLQLQSPRGSITTLPDQTSSPNTPDNIQKRLSSTRWGSSIYLYDYMRENTNPED